MSSLKEATKPIKVMTLFGQVQLRVEVPEGYEEVVKRGLKVEFVKGWFTSPDGKAKKKKQTYQVKMGEVEEVI